MSPVERYHRRLVVLATTAGATALTLIVGCLVMLVGRYGQEACWPYENGATNGANHDLAAWCNHAAYGWLLPTTLVAVAVTLIVLGVASYRRPGSMRIAVPLTLLACALMWAGFALPQVLAG